MTTRDKLGALRQLMKQYKFDAYIIPSTDSHMSEYVPDHWKSRSWISGFTGSAGTVVVTPDFAGVWTDSRYFIQAENQLNNSGFELVKLKIPHTPEHIDWLCESLKEGARIGIDGKVVSIEAVRYMQKMFQKKNIFIETKVDLISEIWKDRPTLPANKAFLHDIKYSGKTCSEKLILLRERMKNAGTHWHLIAGLDDIAWLFNIRGNDVTFNPVVVSYALISMNNAYLFVEKNKFNENDILRLENENVIIKPYHSINSTLSEIQDYSKILLQPSKVNYALFESIPKNLIIEEAINPTTHLKAQKNDVEIENFRKTMEKEGVSIVKLQIWLEKSLDKETITELKISEKLKEFRAIHTDYMGDSFGSIVSYKEHGAIIHYEPSPESDVEIHRDGLLLIDTGGQYLGGTCDSTRVLSLGEPTAQEKKDFTLVLKGTIAVSMLQFPYGTKGFQFDVLARQALWQNGINFGHGTGHGVGCFLNVHEGPQAISPNAAATLTIPFEKGMITSVEPGVYREGKYGIRIENLVLCMEAENTEFGQFMKFETLTLIPIETKLIDFCLLNKQDVLWINSYHQMVYERLSPYLSSEENQWLKEKTKII